MLKGKLQFLPILVIFILLITLIITFYLSYIKYEHVTYLLPYLSDTGTYPPESCIFGQSLNIVAVLIAFLIYIKYLQVEILFRRHHMNKRKFINKLALTIGLLAPIGMSIVANFQETNSLYIHWLGGIITFGSGSIYLCIQSYLYMNISPIIGQRKTTMFRMVLSVIALISFIVWIVTAFMSYAKFTGNDFTKWKKEDGGFELHLISTQSEWISCSAVFIYILLFYTEFKTIHVAPLSINIEEHKTNIAMEA